MQMFFLRNMMGIFIAALIFTAIAIGVVVMRERTSAPDIASQDETTEMAPGNDLDNSASETPSDDFFDPMETPEQRVMEELEGLGVIPNEEGASVQPEVPANPQEAAVATAPSPENDTSVAPQDPVAPNAPPPAAEGALPENNGTVGANEVPIRFGSKAMVIQPKVIRATLKFQEDDSKGEKKPEDPNDPTSEGNGPGGGHKTGKVVNISSIPIIRMGENGSEPEAFKVIKPLHS